ncbi:hypothetical protein IVA80_14255 [Bradyrhizobium sp. 139]|uniref:Rap1a/Tai family immunity protein n=1 Tax=Bradyrhizobium sp. 139 TaxID=2782616 RepID=UPI001FF9197A|nr:Rap1a/Tai family immunity protein [Bradyrhizobium sp. 139]MCK1742005.1 hypothetical protein [Bradyrhizobium sp. 139]
MRLFIIAFLGACFSTGAYADFFDGNDLHKSCLSNNQQAVSFYVAGVFDKSNADVAVTRFYVPASEVERNPSLGSLANAIRSFCVDPNVSLGQVRDVTCKWLVENPARRHYTAALIVQTALAKSVSLLKMKKPYLAPLVCAQPSRPGDGHRS